MAGCENALIKEKLCNKKCKNVTYGFNMLKNIKRRGLNLLKLSRWCAYK